VTEVEHTAGTLVVHVQGIDRLMGSGDSLLLSLGASSGYMSLGSFK
jgi:hypothetical protein